MSSFLNQVFNFRQHLELQAAFDMHLASKDSQYHYGTTECHSHSFCRQFVKSFDSWALGLLDSQTSSCPRYHSEDRLPSR